MGDSYDANAAGGEPTPASGGSEGDFKPHGLPAKKISAAAPENTAELSFGLAFADMQILSNAQVALYLRASAGSAADRDEELHDVYRKTQGYVNRFNTMNNPEKDQQELVDELDNLQDALTTYRKETDEGEELLLHSFEVASLMNLMATDTTAEEALALIPSLSRFPEAAIDEILELIRGTMIRIVS
mmetsp:Transcript_43709/g.85758  ORF Transcript_43709/g.85758 Transcript_43709/m.85758 type:complete len:187 (-) Transcript_43709:176-736(-)